MRLIKRVRLFTCLGGLFCLPLVMQAQNQPNLPTKQSVTDTTANHKGFSQALQEIQDGNYLEAVEKLKTVLEENPNHEQARITLIKLYFMQKEFSNASAVAKQGTELQPENLLFWTALEDIYKETKNYNDLLVVLDKIIALRPDDYKRYLDKAYTYSLLNQEQQALETYKSTDEHFGEKIESAIGKASIYVKEKKFDLAVQELSDFKSKFPDEIKAYLQLTYVYLDQGEVEKAIAELDEAEERFPDNLEIVLSKADAYQQSEQLPLMEKALQKAFEMESMPVERKINILFSIYRDFPKEEAIALAEPLVKILVKVHPDNPNAFAVKGDFYLQKQDYDEALSAFTTAKSLDEKLDIVWENILQIQVGTGKYAEAQKDGEQAVSLFPQNSILQLYTGYAYLLEKKYEKARPHLEEALNYADPQKQDLMIEIYSALGDLYNAIDMPEVSNVAYEEALKLDGENTYVLNNYAYYLSLRKEKLEKAEEMAKKANELHPSNASFEDTYAWVLFQQNKYEEALEWINQAIGNSIDPSSTLLEHKGDILSMVGQKKEAVKFWKLARKSALKEKQSVEKIDIKIKEKEYVE